MKDPQTILGMLNLMVTMGLFSYGFWSFDKKLTRIETSIEQLSLTLQKENFLSINKVESFLSGSKSQIVEEIQKIPNLWNNGTNEVLSKVFQELKNKLPLKEKMYDETILNEDLIRPVLKAGLLTFDIDAESSDFLADCVVSSLKTVQTISIEK